MQQDIWEQTTTPLKRLPTLNAFSAHLREHRLSWANVALLADVRVVVIWKINRGEPVLAEQAQRVQQALTMLHAPYSSTILTT